MKVYVSLYRLGELILPCVIQMVIKTITEIMTGWSEKLLVKNKPTTNNNHTKLHKNLPT